MLLTMELFPYARERGLGTAFVQSRGRWQLALGFAVALFASLALGGTYGVVLLAAASALAWGIGAWAARLLGGATGDIYGAVNELTETALLLIMLAALTFGGSIRAAVAPVLGAVAAVGLSALWLGILGAAIGGLTRACCCSRC